MNKKIVFIFCLSWGMVLSSCDTESNNEIDFPLWLVITNILEMSSSDNTNTLLFYGESENWEIVYMKDPDKTKKAWHLYIVSYRGKKTNDISAKYRISRPSGSSAGGFSLSGNGLDVHSGCCSPDVNNNSVLNAVVEWGGKNEKIELRFVDIQSFLNKREELRGNS